MATAAIRTKNPDASVGIINAPAGLVGLVSCEPLGGGLLKFTCGGWMLVVQQADLVTAELRSD
jgi:hypothetical protein